MTASGSDDENAGRRWRAEGPRRDIWRDGVPPGDRQRVDRDRDRFEDRRRDADRSAGPRRSYRGEDEDDRRSPRGSDDKRGSVDDRTREADEKEGRGKADAENKGDKADVEAEGRRKNRRPLIIAIVVIVALLLLAGGLYYWWSHRDLVATDDAYTDGRAVMIASQVAGQVISLDVTDNQFVHKGDPLIHIDPRQFIYDREQARGAVDTNKAQIASQALGIEIAKKNFPATLLSAQGALTAAKANLLLAELNYNRQKSLPKQATTQQDVDTATASYQQAEAQVQEAQARVVQAEPVQQNIGQSEQQIGQLTGQQEQSQGRLDQSELNIEWAVVRAPQDGWVTRRNVEMGNYVSAGQQVMALVSPDVWITANYKETELDRMRPGQRVKISVDAHPDLDLRGHVDSIQHGSGSRFSAFPAENATGNFVKIVQRVPVKIVIDSGLDPNDPLPLGVSVEPTVMLK